MSNRTLLKTIVITQVFGVLLVACAQMGMSQAKPAPPASEFGYARNSAGGTYRVTIEETQPFKVGQLLTTTVRVESANGQPAGQLMIEVDGGMPQHRHGLPTRPRMTKELGNGRYQIAGLKFNMGGWWELKLRIRAGASADSVTFNLSL
jgi:hypothetical protein